MNYTLRNIVGTVLILFALAFGYYYFFSRQKGQYIPDNWGELGCMYPTNISSDSLEPTLIKGSLLILNQCIKSNTSLNEGDVVLFNNDGLNKIGIIEEIIFEDRVESYVVSTSNFETEKYTLLIDDITAYTEMIEE